MILKAFKEKSNQKFINKLLANRSVNSTKTPMKSVGVLFNAEEYEDYEEFSDFLKTLNIRLPYQKFFTFSKQNTNQYTKWDNVYTTKDIGWNGKLNNGDLQNFTDYPFDVLICYFIAQDTELKQIAAMSKAEIKVGLSRADERLYDIIIALTPDRFEAFKPELKKYLITLNKL